MRLDIAMPAHNEEWRIDRTLDAYRSSCGGGARFLVALDSCTDRTPEIVRAHAAEDPRVIAIEYPKLGKGGVIAETFRRADAELVGFVDADGATPPRELLRLAEAAGHTDGAIASRRHSASLLPARRPLSRAITLAGFAGSVRMLMGLPYRDSQCGAEVLRREVVDDVLPHLAAGLGLDAGEPAAPRRPARLALEGRPGGGASPRRTPTSTRRARCWWHRAGSAIPATAPTASGSAARCSRA